MLIKVKEKIDTSSRLFTSEMDIPKGHIGTIVNDDKLIFTQAENITPILQRAHDIRTYSDNGWTEDKNFRQIGSVPHIEFLRHPEWMHEPGLIVRWLRSDEGAPFRTVTKGL